MSLTGRLLSSPMPGRWISPPFTALPRAIVLVAALWSARPETTAGADAVLYATDFSEFETGLDTLARHGGWESTHPSGQAHGIVEDAFPGQGKTAFVGEKRTGSDWVSVYRPVSYDPLAENTPVVKFSVRFAVRDSTNGRYDSFFFSFYNQDIDILAAVVLDNSEEFFGIWRYDGTEYFDTPLFFRHDNLHLLECSVDFAANTWTALLDGRLLFENAPFHTSGLPLYLADVAAEWELSNETRPGNNLLYFDDWKVSVATASPPAAPPAVSIVPLANGDIRLRWLASPGETFQVQRSSDLIQWLEDLPGSRFTVPPGSTVAEFVDLQPTDPKRHYRVGRISAAGAQ